MKVEPKPTLDYRSTATSAYDKPVDQSVDAAHKLGFMRRWRKRNWIIYYALLLPLIAALIWYVRHMMFAYERAMR